MDATRRSDANPAEGAAHGYIKAKDKERHSKADIEKGTVEVFFDEGKVSTADLKGAIEGAGYTLAA